MSLERLPREVHYMIGDNLEDADLLPLVTSCRYFLTLLHYFVVRRHGNGLLSLAKRQHWNLLREALHTPDLNINVEDSEGETVLAHAAGPGHDITKDLLAYPGVNVNVKARVGYGQSLLHQQVRRKRINIIRQIVSIESADLSMHNMCSHTPLHAAVFEGLEVFNALLTPYQERYNLRLLEREVLNFAIQQRAKLIALRILQIEGVDPDRPDEYGSTPLHYAAGCGLEPVVEALSERGVQLHAVDIEDCNALQHAGRSGQLAMIKLLLGLGLSPRGDGSILRTAAAQADHELFARLYADRSYDHTVDDLDLLKSAVQGNEARIIRQVLQSNSNMSWMSLLTVAAEFDNIDVFSSALPHVPSEKTQICLSEIFLLAAGNDSVSVMQSLLELGAALNHQDSSGRTALYLAAANNRIWAVSFLLEQTEVNPNIPDGRGLTPLQYISDLWPSPIRMIRLLALDPRTRPAAFDDGGVALTSALRRAKLYSTLAILRNVGFSDPGYRPRNNGLRKAV